MASGDSFSRASVARPRESGHSQAALHRLRACVPRRDEIRVRMDRPAPGLRLEAITPPRQEIMRIWRTLRPGTELAPTIEEYTVLIQRPTSTTQGIFVPNPFARGSAWQDKRIAAPTTDLAPRARLPLLLITSFLLHHGRAFTDRAPGTGRPTSRAQLFGIEALLARIDPRGPMITGCSEIVGVPLLSHLGSTLIFPSRVIRQLGGLQDIPAEADHLPYRIQWVDSTSTAPARFLQIREIHRQRDAST
ncbi:hypothetical protein CRG98_020032, partial [Punica granatum]